MLVLKRKQIVGVSLIVLVAIAGVIQWVYGPTKEKPLAVDSNLTDTGLPRTASENIILFGDEDAEDKTDKTDKTGQAQYVSGTGDKSAVDAEGGDTDPTAVDGDVVDGTGDGMDAVTDVNATGGEYFADARLQKETAKSMAISTLNDLIENPNADKAAKESAQKQILAFASAQKSEVACENIIKAKGFSDSVVFINAENVTVVVKCDKLSESDVAKIQDIITAQVKVDGKNVKIVEVA